LLPAQSTRLTCQPNNSEELAAAPAKNLPERNSLFQKLVAVIHPAKKSS
jgi:hypothetical protein